MKKFIYAVSGVLVVFAVRLLDRARTAQERLSDRLEDIDTKQLRKQLERLPVQRRGDIRKQVATLAATAESVRDRKLAKQIKQLQKRADKVDFSKLQKQQKHLKGAVQRRQSRRFPVVPVMLVAGVIGLGVLVGMRRQQITTQLGGLQDGAGKLPTAKVLDSIRSRSGAAQKANEQELQAGVESAIHSAAPAIAPDLKVEVEGRTVYLRGATTDRELLESAVRRAQEVQGVAAVINLVSMTPASSNGASQPAGATTNQS